MAGAPLHKTQPTLSNKPKAHNMSHYIIFQKQTVQNTKLLIMMKKLVK